MRYGTKGKRTRLGHLYLCVPTALEIRGESQAPPEQKHATIALDPGVRTFMTGYDANGAVYEWGDADMDRIYRLCHALATLTHWHWHCGRREAPP